MTTDIIEYKDLPYEYDILSLAHSVLESQWHPDLIVGLSRGGLVPAVHLSHFLNVEMYPLNWGSQSTKLENTYLRDIINYDNKKVLIVDDIVDSGSTLHNLIRALDCLPHLVLNLENIRVLATYNNTDLNEIYSNSSGKLKCDYYARGISRDKDKRWVQFPWEKRWIIQVP